MEVDNRIKTLVIDMLQTSSLESVISFCEELGIEGECVDILRNEQRRWLAIQGDDLPIK